MCTVHVTPIHEDWYWCIKGRLEKFIYKNDSFISYSGIGHSYECGDDNQYTISITVKRDYEEDYGEFYDEIVYYEL